MGILYGIYLLAAEEAALATLALAFARLTVTRPSVRGIYLFRLSAGRTN